MSVTQRDADANRDDQDESMTTFRTDGTTHFPTELVETEQWLVWRSEDDTKVPYAPEQPSVCTGTASPDDWTDFRTAYETFRSTEDIDGLGFVFTDDDPYVGLDLDYVRNDDGTASDWALDVIERISSFTELSPSGEGAHIIARGELDDEYQQRDNERGLEMYETGRFFTMTGDVLVNAEDSVRERTDSVISVQHDYMSERQQGTTTNLTDWDESAATRSPSRDEADMIDFMCNVNDKFERLHNGSNTGYASPSEADQAYFQQLAWLTAKDKELMVRLARSSDRVRPKWDESRGNSNWLRRDIERAIRQTTSTCNKFD